MKHLNELRLKNINKLVICHLNIYSLSNKFDQLKLIIKNNVDFLEHVYMRHEVNSDRFGISNHFEKMFYLKSDFTAATFQTIIRLYSTCANHNFLKLMQI